MYTNFRNRALPISSHGDIRLTSRGPSFQGILFRLLWPQLAFLAVGVMAVMYHFCYSCLWLVLLTRTWIYFVLFEAFLGNRFKASLGNGVAALLLPLMFIACRQHETLVLRLFITIISRGWHCHHEPWQHESILLHYVERGDLSLPLSRTSLVSTSHYGVCPLGKFKLRDLAKLTALASILCL